MGAGLTALLDRADAALRCATDAPSLAVELATPVLHEAVCAGEPEAAAVAERALGLAHRELLDVPGAEAHLRESIRHAESGGLPVRAAEARLSLAVELVDKGRPAAALRELGRACADLGDGHAQLQIQLALVYARFSRFDDALECCDRALEAAESLGQHQLAARALGNRGLVQAYRGELDAAEVDLRRAQVEHDRVGERLFALDSTHNLGWLLVRRFRLPEALALLDQAEAGIAELGVPLAPLRVDRAEALLAAGLADEAEGLAAAAARELRAAGRHGELAEALLLVARAALLRGRTATAAQTAREAQQLFSAQDRGSWAALAEGVAARAARTTDDSDLASAAETLAAHGLADDAAELQLLRGRRLLAAGEAPRAEELLLPLLRTRRSSADRVRAGVAGLLIAEARGDDRAALRSAAASLTALAEQRQTWGALELQTASGLHARDAVSRALAVAVRGRPADVLTWADRARAGLPGSDVDPPDDDLLAHDLEQLRTFGMQRRQALLDDEPADRLHARQRALEESVRRRSRHLGTRGDGVLGQVSLGRVRARLDGRSLVSLFEVGDELLAQVVTARSSRVVRLGDGRASLDATRQLRLALRLTVLGRPRAAAVRDAAVALEQRLGPALADGSGVVMVPTPALASVPWSALPCLTDRDVEVAPTVGLWCRPAGTPGDHDVVVAGPHLASADDEAHDVGALRPGATVLTGADATAGAVLAALEGAATAHLACHGTFRDDNPMFSSLLLHDGPVTVHELTRLRAAPQHVVLSACDSGRGGEAAGQELLGAAAALLTRGTQTVVASTVPVDDTATRALMTALHRHWSPTTRPATALRRAQAEMTCAVGVATAQAFVCLTARAPAG